MEWYRGKKTFTNIRRECDRLRETLCENALSTQEVEAFSHLLHEIAWAVVEAQPWPMGHGTSLSAECIAAFRAAAQMAERERIAKSRGAYVRLLPLSGGEGTIVPFPAPEGE